MLVLCVQSWLRRLVRALGRAIASVVLLSLITSCSVSRQASEVSGFKVQDARVEWDSLREEIAQNLNENLTEHEVITETVFLGDSVRLERVADRVTVRDRSARTEAMKEGVRIVRDTVYIERRDSVRGQESRNFGPTEARASPVVSALRWIFGIIVLVIILVTIFKYRRF